ncbi:MAG: hypothetical protein KME13_18560 [Myxacorys californica WJT36-NPBG1]|jgi:hypothetical protein|nr:hypothetical protein [Myxacorys californica WJT36-NPBG1]
MFSLKKIVSILFTTAITVGSLSFASSDAWARGGAGGGRGGSSSYSGQSGGGRVSVRGYTRKDGTYVRSHTRSNPNGRFQFGSNSGSFSTGRLRSTSGSSNLTSPLNTPDLNSYPYPDNINPIKKVHPKDKQAYASPDDEGMGLAYTPEGNVDLYLMYMDWGNEALSQYQYQTALNWFKKALAIRPSSVEAVKAVQTTKALIASSRN